LTDVRIDALLRIDAPTFGIDREAGSRLYRLPLTFVTSYSF
jgi:hypothetical protein